MRFVAVFQIQREWIFGLKEQSNSNRTIILQSHWISMHKISSIEKIKKLKALENTVLWGITKSLNEINWTFSSMNYERKNNELLVFTHPNLLAYFMKNNPYKQPEYFICTEAVWKCSRTIHEIQWILKQ